MLTDIDLLAWYTKLALAERTRMVINHIRSSDPARRVGGGRRTAMPQRLFQGVLALCSSGSDIGPDRAAAGTGGVADAGQIRIDIVVLQRVESG